MATRRQPIPPAPRTSAGDARRRTAGLPALLRASRGRRTIGLVALVLVLATVLTVALLPGGSAGSGFAGLSDPLRSAADLLEANRETPSAGPPSPSASGAPSPSAAPSRPPSKTAAPPDATIINPHRADCAARPSACGLPDATNTGVPAGTTLKIHNGDITVKSAGTVIDRQDIRGCIRVQAPRVTIRRSKIACPSFPVIASFDGEYSGTGLVVEDSEISCMGTNGTGLSDTNVTARRLNIHGCENGFDINASFTVADSYVHDLFQSSEAHTDGIQLAGGADISINHNTIFANNGNSAIISARSDNSDVVVSNNLMAGGAYTLFCPRETSQNFRVIGNRVASLFYPKGGAFGPWTECEKVAEVRGNVWDQTLKPL
jgi:hypothetical protein